jgi:hypothetical protein
MRHDVFGIFDLGDAGKVYNFHENLFHRKYSPQHSSTLKNIENISSCHYIKRLQWNQVVPSLVVRDTEKVSYKVSYHFGF